MKLKHNLFTVYTSQLQEVSPLLPATIMMDEELPASPEDELSSPHEYTACSPKDEPETSPQSTHETNSDIEVDV